MYLQSPLVICIQQNKNCIFVLMSLAVLSASRHLKKEFLMFVCVSLLQVLQDVTGEEFLMLMRVLSGLATMSTLQGRKQLVEIVCEQADLDAQFDVSSCQVGKMGRLYLPCCHPHIPAVYGILLVWFRCGLFSIEYMKITLVSTCGSFKIILNTS